MQSAKTKQPAVTSLATEGARLAELRTRVFQCSQSQFAQWIWGNEEQPAQPQQMCSQWETGKRPMPYRKVAMATGASIDWLMGAGAQMWSDRVLQLRQSLRNYLAGLSAERKAWLRSPAADPGDRISFIIQFLQLSDPDLITERYLGYLLVAGETCTLGEIMAGTTHADRYVYERLARFLDIPVPFFEFGETSAFERNMCEQYRGVVEHCVARGISPERLEQIIKVI